jgi:putative transposase
LSGEIAVAARDILSGIRQRNNWPLLALEVQVDHMHLFVSFPPPISISNAVKILKGVSARKFLVKFEQL